ncbi:MAG: hypothetical protein R3C24_18325 [Cyanobacteriota/Melainabacteria group bacterium]
MSLLEIENQLKAFESEAIEAFQSVSDLKELENLRQKYLGKKGTQKPSRRAWVSSTPESRTPQVGSTHQRRLREAGKRPYTTQRRTSSKKNSWLA